MIDRPRRAALVTAPLTAALLATGGAWGTSDAGAAAPQAAGAGTAANPVRTTRAPMLTALAPGVHLDPILSTGDVVGGRVGGYQMSGMPDGLGSYASSRNRLELFVNSELDGTAPAGVGARSAT